ncbi:MAG: DJ-1/PfpI family protein [Ruminococcaceae bacterium]|nr:DJ-1/PfpI family protein [Oscillospiraceae bacterium]
MVYLFLADGFEEVEALCPLDLLRRAGAQVQTVGVTGKLVTGAHDITVTADILPEDIVLDRSLEMIILPGGMPGTTNLDASGVVHEAIRFATERGITVGAICAAPMIIGKLGYLSGRSAVCYPGFEKYLIGANISAKPVVVDEHFITAKGMGVAAQFGLALVGALYGEEAVSELFKSTMMQ